MPIEANVKIPEAILLPQALKARAKLNSDPEAWTDYEIEIIRCYCGERYANVPLQNIRRHCCGMRKRKLLGTLNGTKNHGAAKITPKPNWYKEYLRSEHWKEFRRKVLEFWNYKCAVCYWEENLEVHHRTYDRLNDELMTDCIALCRECHKNANRRIDRMQKNQHANNQIMLYKQELLDHE